MVVFDDSNQRYLRCLNASATWKIRSAVYNNERDSLLLLIYDMGYIKTVEVPIQPLIEAINSTT